MAKTRKPRERKPKQGYLDPDLAPPSIAELDRAAENYVEARDERMELTKHEVEKAELLMNLMVKHSLKTYTTDTGKIVNLSEVTKVKVRRAKESNGTGEE